MRIINLKIKTEQTYDHILTLTEVKIALVNKIEDNTQIYIRRLDDSINALNPLYKSLLN